MFDEPDIATLRGSRQVNTRDGSAYKYKGYQHTLEDDVRTAYRQGRSTEEGTQTHGIVDELWALKNEPETFNKIPTREMFLADHAKYSPAVPEMHVHAFSPLEVWQGAATLDVSLSDYLRRLQQAGLNTLPGTAAEILDDEVRAVICADKINTQQWLDVMRAAHDLGFKTTATIMYGHVEQPVHWARHLMRVRALQEQTGGFTEFVPLPFVHMEAPMYLKGKARKGPTFREAILMHAVARLALHGQIDNIQTSWVKMGHEGVKGCLNAGCNDLGGTLMNESISRAAGTLHGEETSPQQMNQIIRTLNRNPRQRATNYANVNQERINAGMRQIELVQIVNTPARKYERKRSSDELIRNEPRAVETNAPRSSGTTGT